MTPGRQAGPSLAAAVVAALALVACGSSSSAAGGPSVRVGKSRFGAILVDGAGRSLYVFGRDVAGRSACAGACARVWPPARVAGSPRAGAGVAAAGLGAIRRPDRSVQLTYDNHPLYTFSGDTAAGQIGGEGFLGTWFLVSPAGTKVVDPTAAPAAAGY